MTPADALLRSSYAASPRTLLDIFDETVATHPDAPAIDDGQASVTYAELGIMIDAAATNLRSRGVTPGDCVGVRISSGTVELYAAVLAVMAAGASYVPVDVDDPEERARTVFDEAGVALVLSDGDLGVEPSGQAPVPRPSLDDGAWIIFTSGSTGTPKGVAVSQRSAAAFVDAEARIFLTEAPLGPGDRVLAGLSVAFDASCEEMWLAWRYGACLVPAPRALVRTGMDLGPWLVYQEITVISTVPTLAGLLQPEQLERIRLLIFGGEAVPPELAARLVADGREVWNTYGPTEATVVACASLMDGVSEVRIGLPLDGWDLAVVNPSGERVVPGEAGELMIGGVGLARYLDPAKDAEKYAPAPALGWERAYRSGDLVREDPGGLVFLGRADDQVKIGGRRIELGEVDAALLEVPDVAMAAAAVRRTSGGAAVLIGYLAPTGSGTVDVAEARRLLRERLPAALIPQLAVVPEIPTRGSGKVDRDALPWPLEQSVDDEGPSGNLSDLEYWIAVHWTAALGAPVQGPDEDFFDSGGGSLTAAQLVSALRERYPTVAVADLYDYPRLADLAARLSELDPREERETASIAPTPVSAQVLQTLAGLVLATWVGLRWLTWILLTVAIVESLDLLSWVPTVPGAWLWGLIGWVVCISPLGRMGSTVLVARTLLRGIRPGHYRRGGATHLKVWFVESWADAAGVGNLSCAPWTVTYARALGAKVGAGIDLHSLPPVTGMLTLGAGCAIEPEVDLAGHWLDGDTFVVGRVRVDKKATVGTRSTLGPGSRVGQGAEIAAGTAVSGSIPPGELWAGSPAKFVGPARVPWPRKRAPRGRRWVAIYGASAAALGALPVVAAVAGLTVVASATAHDTTLGEAAPDALLWAPVGALAYLAVLAIVIWVGVRLTSIGMRAGYYPVRSRKGWQIWATLRLMDEARTRLYGLYASSATPWWLRSLGARIGKDVEASTVLMLPRMTRVGRGAFLADDTLIGSYELGRGWMRVEKARIGRKAFLGNSGMIAPGRSVPKGGLVAVLSATPRKANKAKKGTSWIGSPPEKLRRVNVKADKERAYSPPTKLRVARALVEVCRVVPEMLSFTLGTAVMLTLLALVETHGIALAFLVSGLVVLGAAVAGALIAVAAKWALVGRIRSGDHPLWSSFIWRNELADTFVEKVAVPWLGPATDGSPVLNLWLRALGARIGRGVWCESYWLPEADLVSLGDGSTVNRGCVVQTHLFHDRVMSIDTVTLAAGATLGPHGVILPAASIGPDASVGPASLVLRGDAIPSGTRWQGNPVAPVSE
nr:Pls/PosA family non-ribosomal peptide synthetase [Demequina flava]